MTQVRNLSYHLHRVDHLLLHGLLPLEVVQQPIPLLVLVRLDQVLVDALRVPDGGSVLGQLLTFGELRIDSSIGDISINTNYSIAIYCPQKEQGFDYHWLEMVTLAGTRLIIFHKTTNS